MQKLRWTERGWSRGFSYCSWKFQSRSGVGGDDGEQVEGSGHRLGRRTASVMVGSAWPKMTPFAIPEASYFRPAPPIPLQSKEWATDYNEIKDLGGKSSAKRTPQQTETAKFWLMVGPPAYHPVARQIALARGMSVADSARFMALYSAALTDAYIAVFDAKYHYEFWRPVTAIRNGDIDSNPDTAFDPTWQPIDATPMHPEYPCAHCIESGAAAAVIEATLGSANIPEANFDQLNRARGHASVDEHRDLRERDRGSAHLRRLPLPLLDPRRRKMGRKIGAYVAANILQPIDQR